MLAVVLNCYSRNELTRAGADTDSNVLDSSNHARVLRDTDM